MVLNFSNSAHFGDLMFSLHYFIKLIKIHDDLKINFYIDNFYMSEMEKQIVGFDISLFPIVMKPEDTINMWFGRSDFNHGKILNEMRNRSTIDLLIKFYQFISDILKIENPIKTKQDFIQQNPNILKDNILSGKFDILIVNSMALSGQYENNNSDFVDLIIKIKNEIPDIKIITTYHTGIDGIPCTLNYNLSLMDIGNLSLYCDYIIGVSTGPLVNCFNVWNIDKIKKYYILNSSGEAYDFNDRCLNYKYLSDCKDEILIEIIKNYKKL